jgi:hypothetical protein
VLWDFSCFGAEVRGEEKVMLSQVQMKSFDGFWCSQPWGSYSEFLRIF